MITTTADIPVDLIDSDDSEGSVDDMDGSIRKTLVRRKRVSSTIDFFSSISVLESPHSPKRGYTVPSADSQQKQKKNQFLQRVEEAFDSGDVPSKPAGRSSSTLEKLREQGKVTNTIKDLTDYMNEKGTHQEDHHHNIDTGRSSLITDEDKSNHSEGSEDYDFFASKDNLITVEPLSSPSKNKTSSTSSQKRISFLDDQDGGGLDSLASPVKRNTMKVDRSKKRASALKRTSFLNDQNHHYHSNLDDFDDFDVSDEKTRPVKTLLRSNSRLSLVEQKKVAKTMHALTKSFKRKSSKDLHRDSDIRNNLRAEAKVTNAVRDYTESASTSSVEITSNGNIGRSNGSFSTSSFSEQQDTGNDKHLHEDYPEKKAEQRSSSSSSTASTSDTETTESTTDRISFVGERHSTTTTFYTARRDSTVTFLTAHGSMTERESLTERASMLQLEDLTESISDAAQSLPPLPAPLPGESLQVDPLGSLKIDFDKVYYLGDKINEGGFGVVYKAHHVSMDPSAEVAVKVVHRSTVNDKEALHESTMLRDIRDVPNVTKIFDFYMDDEEIFVVQELAAGGDVLDRLLQKEKYTESDSRDLARHLIETVSYLHDRKLVHRDIKAENLLLKTTESDSNILLCDFGYAKYLPDDDSGLRTFCGTPAYTAPEIISGTEYFAEVDMWSVGCLIYMLLSGFLPFVGSNATELYNFIATADYTFDDDEVWKIISPEAKALISNLLVLDGRTNRLSAKEALDCDWFSPCERLSSKLEATDLTDLVIEHIQDYCDNTRPYNDDSKRVVDENYTGENDVKYEAQPQRIPEPGESLDVDPLGSLKVPFDQVYVLDDKINEGFFGVVYKAHHVSLDLSAQVAVKVVNRSDENDEEAMHESSILRDIRDVPNVTKLFDFFMDDEKIYVVQELACGGDVLDRLLEREKYSESDARDLASILLGTVADLHERRMVHRDLKPENLLLKTTQSDTNILLCDYGFSKYLPDDGVSGLWTFCGTPEYTAPEILNGVEYWTEVDMWSIGCIIFMLLSGFQPFVGDNTADLCEMIVAGDWSFDYEKEAWEMVSAEAKTLITKLLALDGKNDRISAADALQCEWFSPAPSYKDQLEATDLKEVVVENIQEYCEKTKPKNESKNRCVDETFTAKDDAKYAKSRPGRKKNTKKKKKKKKDGRKSKKVKIDADAAKAIKAADEGNSESAKATKEEKRKSDKSKSKSKSKNKTSGGSQSIDAIDKEQNKSEASDKPIGSSEDSQKNSAAKKEKSAEEESAERRKEMKRKLKELKRLQKLKEAGEAEQKSKEEANGSSSKVDADADTGIKSLPDAESKESAGKPEHSSPQEETAQQEAEPETVNAEKSPKKEDGSEKKRKKKKEKKDGLQERMAALKAERARVKERLAQKQKLIEEEADEAKRYLDVAENFQSKDLSHQEKIAALKAERQRVKERLAQKQEMIEVNSPKLGSKSSRVSRSKSPKRDSKSPKEPSTPKDIKSPKESRSPKEARTPKDSKALKHKKSKKEKSPKPDEDN